MDKFAVTETFYSLQGEGRYAGVPSVFIRTFGCNFRCKSFNRPRDEVLGKYNPDVIPIIANLDKYPEFKDLPLVSTGCDTYSSIYPEFKRYADHFTPFELAARAVDLTPFHQLEDHTHVVITGGEPLLGWQVLYPQLIKDLKYHGNLHYLTFETNGTQPLHMDFANYLNNELPVEEILFSVSPKLSASGEPFDKAIQWEVIKQYASIKRSKVTLKFVVDRIQDMDEVWRAIDLYEKGIIIEGDSIYLMPVGGTVESLRLNETEVAELALKNGFRFSPRLQVPLWKNAWGT
jgi:organic radical activating enzyme